MRWSTRRLIGLRAHEDPTQFIEQELVGERAAALGRLGRGVEDAVARWHRIDADPAATVEQREDALVTLGRAVWLLLVQRESSGFHTDNLGWIQRLYDVPDVALRRMGAKWGRDIRVDPEREAVSHDGIPPLGPPGRRTR